MFQKPIKHNKKCRFFSLLYFRQRNLAKATYLTNELHYYFYTESNKILKKNRCISKYL